MVEGGGFEPPKAEPSDLQSDPFGHSGTPPKIKPPILLENRDAVNHTYAETAPRIARGGGVVPPNDGDTPRIGAGERSRTLDLRITSALLYQLSYSGLC